MHFQKTVLLLLLLLLLFVVIGILGVHWLDTEILMFLQLVCLVMFPVTLIFSFSLKVDVLVYA
jgi:hypothetical protein